MSFDALLAVTNRAVVGGPLADAVTYTASGGATADVSGIFDAVYVKVDATQAGVSSVGPAVFLLLADLPSDPTTDNATVTVNGADYTVREAEPDGKGGVLLLLHEA